MSLQTSESSVGRHAAAPRRSCRCRRKKWHPTIGRCTNRLRRTPLPQAARDLSYASCEDEAKCRTNDGERWSVAQCSVTIAFEEYQRISCGEKAGIRNSRASALRERPSCKNNQQHGVAPVDLRTTTPNCLPQARALEYNQFAP